MRALGPASHCSLDNSSDRSLDLSLDVDLDLDSSTSNSRASSRPSFKLGAPTPVPQNKNKPPTTPITIAPPNSRRASSATRAPTAAAAAPSSKYAALTDAHAQRPPRALRPALHQQAQAPRARPSVRSTPDPLPPRSNSQSRPPLTLNFDRSRRRSSFSLQPATPGAPNTSTRSSSNSSSATSASRSLSASYGSAASSTSGSAPPVKPRRSLGANNTPAAARAPEERGRRRGSVSTGPATSAQHRPPRPTSAAPPAARRPASTQHQDDTLPPSAPAGLVKQATVVVSRTPAMPVDRPGQGSAAARPTMPTLSATAMRSANRAPLMPKVATKGHQGPAIAPTILTTPNPKRIQQPRTGTHHNLDTDSPSTDTASPHLASHVTPRSGTRQVRVDSASSTPNGTPNLDRHDGWDPLPGNAGPLPNIEAPNFKRSNASFSSLPGDHASAARAETHKAVDSKFFHASEVRPSLPRPASGIKQTPSKPPTFFYANGNNVGDTPPAAAQSAPAVAQQAHNDGQSKFLYANGAPELRPSPPLSRGSSSGVPGNTQKPAGRPSSGSLNGPQIGGYAAQRPSSPVKLAGHSQQPLSKLQAVPAPLGTPPRSHVTSPQPAPTSRNSIRRTSSGTSSRIGNHSRTGSLVSGEPAHIATRFISPQLSPSFMAEPVSPLHAPSTPAPLTLASIIQAATELEDAEPSDASSVGEDHSELLLSPTKSATSADPINELVANARRERKVQDLEITNASLEAINRTLERQLRKQTAEIRRFKRMSRTGRISLASSDLPSREASELPNGEQTMDLSLTDLSEEGSDQDDLDEESLSDSESTSESMSPSLTAEKDSRHRRRDEKRLRLDLSKHQEMLVDSQKLNQSILRCMSWTEELIKEGQKALDYRVRVSEIKLGGRVLDPLDTEDNVDNAALGSGDIDATLAELDVIAADLDETS
ncbi:hypothetical protein Micbo1qcDRAFT_64252 [Microdochium bolleyi]|uniref:Uncharacterized protein n=1 Tax=Microdochium bolleyi TaxID=196109 RepID=A0A136J2A6_9PEZI|nr:hypothetical protein Micbo1qcDRAFT_64252 [Microdochium bolleyi]